MADCIFCAIAAGEVPSAKLYEDENVFAFLDVHPLRQGHALVVPRRHAERLEATEPEEAAALVRAARRLLAPLCQAAGCDDATLAINNGPDAGQEVPHLHLHIVPRPADDGAGPVHALFADRPDVDPEALQAMAQSVRIRLEASA